MTSNFGPMPGMGGAMAPASPSLEGLLGGTPPEMGGPPPQAQDESKAAMAQIRDLHMQLEALAGQYPEAAAEFQQMKQISTSAMTKIVSARTAMEPPAPAPGM